MLNMGIVYTRLKIRDMIPLALPLIVIRHLRIPIFHAPYNGVQITAKLQLSAVANTQFGSVGSCEYKQFRARSAFRERCI